MVEERRKKSKSQVTKTLNKLRNILWKLIDLKRSPSVSKASKQTSALTASAATDMMSRPVKTLFTKSIKSARSIWGYSCSLIPRLPTESIKM